MSSARRLGWLVFSATLAAAAGCKVSCSAGDGSIAERVEREVGEKAADSLRDVRCPRDIEGKQGEITTCRATGRDGQPLIVEVRWTDDIGHFVSTWRLEDAALARRVADVIRDGLSAKYEVTFSGVECAEKPPVEGASFECAATIEGGSRLPVTVTWTDRSGKFEYADKGVVLLDRLAALLGEQMAARGTPATVDCHGKIRASEPGSVFPCTVRFADGRTEELPVTVDDWTGHVRW